MAGQTLTQIRTLLAEAGLSPQHRLGQNFLIDLNLMRKALAAAEVAAGDVVLEVGAGTGSLTELLLDAGCRVIAVEIDRGLLGILQNRFADHPRLQLIAGDALAGKHRLNPEMTAALHSAAGGKSWKLVANLPYQIATPLLMELLLLDPPAACLTCTIQKEVGERLTAEPRTAAYGPASVLVQSLARVRRIAVLPPRAFWPRPKVDSVMLRIDPLPTDERPIDDVRAFQSLVQGAFTLRRKKLHHGLRAAKIEDASDLLDQAGVSRDARPEELSAADWRRVHRLLAARRLR